MSVELPQEHQIIGEIERAEKESERIPKEAKKIVVQLDLEELKKLVRTRILDLGVLTEHVRSLAQAVHRVFLSPKNPDLMDELTDTEYRVRQAIRGLLQEKNI